MRQLKNCKVGHFVKYNGILCQVNCFFTNLHGKQATLTEVKHGKKQFFFADVTEKVEYLGISATDAEGRFWVFKKHDPIEDWNLNHK